MKKPLSVILTATFVLAFLPVALADTKSAAACAASLSANQKLIYMDVLPELTQNVNLTALVRKKVIALVRIGRLPMSTAPDDAKAAAVCLKMKLK